MVDYVLIQFFWWYFVEKPIVSDVTLMNLLMAPVLNFKLLMLILYYCWCFRILGFSFRLMRSCLRWAAYFTSREYEIHEFEKENMHEYLC